MTWMIRYKFETCYTSGTTCYFTPSHMLRSNSLKGSTHILVAALPECNSIEDNRTAEVIGKLGS